MRSRFVSIVLSSVCILSLVQEAKAAVYECNAEQVISWKGGRFKFLTKPFPYSFVKIDEKKSTLYVAYDDATSGSEVSLNVLQKLGPETDLVAVPNYPNNLGSGHVDTIRLRTWDKDSGPFFLLLDSDNSLATIGRCTIDTDQ